MVMQHNLTSASNGHKDFGNGNSQTAKQQITAALEQLQMELDQADWVETGPLRSRIRKLTEMVSVLPYQDDDKQQKKVQQLQAIAAKIRQCSHLDNLLATAVVEVQTALQLERVVVYQFANATSGTVVAEAVADGLTPMLGEKLPAVSFGLGSAQLYQQEQLVGIADVQTASLSPYQKQLLDRFQTRAFLSLPILNNDKVWGLLVVQQCSAPKEWPDSEIQFLKLVSQELEMQLLLAAIRTQLQQEVQKDEMLVGVANKILQSLSLDSIFRTTTVTTRQLLQCDRVAVYRFHPDWSGEFVAESVGSQWVSLLEEQRNDPTIVDNVNYCSIRDLAVGAPRVADTDLAITAAGRASEGRMQLADSYIQRTEGKTFHRGQIYRVTNDIYAANFSDCYIKVLETYQARAYIIVAIFQGEQLWGLLAAYQNSGPREWKDTEVRLTVQIATLCSIAMQQLQYQQQLSTRAQELAQLAEWERTVFRIIDKIGQATDIQNIFRTTTQELRRFLKCDRVAIYQFYSDWSGEVVAESVAAGWCSLFEAQQQEQLLKTGLISSERCYVKEYKSPPKPDTDTYLQETQGGIYSRGTRWRQVNDIYAANFSPCYLEVLEKLQAKAYIIVPIFQTDRLWGLLAAYQNTGVREWSEQEATALLHVSSELSIALQQAEYIEKLQKKTQK